MASKTYIAFLRGINVGGKNKLPMKPFLYRPFLSPDWHELKHFQVRFLCRRRKQPVEFPDVFGGQFDL
jgi:Protein of unknown function (DUF1697)